jgi:hypothetical protein
MKAADTPISARAVAHLHGALAAQPVPDTAAGQQQAGEGEAIDVDDPL